MHPTYRKPKMVAMATSLRTSTSAMSSSDSLTPKTHPRIKERVASYHTTEVMAHRKAKKGCHGNVPPHCQTRHDSYSPSEPTTQTASRSVQPYSHRGLQSVPILYNGPSPSKLPLPMGGSGSPSNTRFSHFCRAH